MTVRKEDLMKALIKTFTPYFAVVAPDGECGIFMVEGEEKGDGEGDGEWEEEEEEEGEWEEEGDGNGVGVGEWEGLVLELWKNSFRFTR